MANGLTKSLSFFVGLIFLKMYVVSPYMFKKHLILISLDVGRSRGNTILGRCFFFLVQILGRC